MSEPRMLGLRLYACASLAVSALSLDVYPSNLVSVVLDSSLLPWVSAFLLTVCLVAAADTIVNDVLPDRWSLKWLQNWRHHEFIGIAAVNLILIFLVVSRGLQGSELARYALDAAMAVYIAFRDVQLRFMKPRIKERAHVSHR